MVKEWAVETEELVSSAAVIEEKTEKYNAEWAKLYTELENLRASQWKGIASDTFNTKLEGYRNDFQEMANVLNSYAEFLRNTAENYSSTEDDLNSLANGLYTGN